MKKKPANARINVRGTGDRRHRGDEEYPLTDIAKE